MMVSGELGACGYGRRGRSGRAGVDAEQRDDEVYAEIRLHIVVRLRTVSFTLTDGDGGTSNVATASVEVTPVNDTTDAKDDSANTDEATVKTIDVLANDVAVDGPAKSVSHIDGTAIAVGGSVTLTSGAKVTLNQDGTLSYDPNGKFNHLTGPSSDGGNKSADDSFTYTEADGDTATVTVTVTGVTSTGDRFVGGPEDNVFYVDDKEDTVVELPNGGNDTVHTALGSRTDFNDLYVIPDNVEVLIGTSSTGQGVKDNAGNNTITMGSGNDLVVLGMGGEDIVNGGGGNDFLYFGNSWSSGDQAIGGAGNDRIGLLGTQTIVFEEGDLSSIEQISAYGSTGDDGPFSYSLTMHDSNVASGESLFVTAAGLRANETLYFNGLAETDGSFRVQGGAGADQIIGGDKGDYLIGNAGDDQLFGRGGNDTLVGGAGQDLLRGGSGLDIFRFVAVSDSTVAAPDTIADFQMGDKIDLSAIDANSLLEGNQAFKFIGGANFSGTSQAPAAGELRASYDAVTKLWSVAGDIDGDGTADFLILVSRPSELPIVASDFLL
jgi:VCBS repeat-containing protein